MSCSSGRYILVSHEYLKNQIEKKGELSLKKYLLLPGEYENQELSFLQSEPSKTVITYLSEGRRKKAKHYLKKNYVKNDTSSIFAMALVALFNKNYGLCRNFTEKMGNYSENCFIQFISSDCSYERNWLIGNANYRVYLEKYQNVLDCAYDDDIHRELVKARMKRIRYGLNE